MQPKIETIKEKTLIGMSESMSLVENKTFKLFSSFMPRRNEILHSVSNTIYDLREYPEDYYQEFKPTNSFIKWALIEISEIDSIPKDMTVFNLPSGKYAVFIENVQYSGDHLFEYVFTEWLPNAKYVLDNRPHFDILGEKHLQKDPSAKLELWIPIKSKP